MADLANTHNPSVSNLRAIRLLIAEYRRAIAAEDYYASLKCMSMTARAQEGIARCDIPRRVFDEFYLFHSE